MKAAVDVLQPRHRRRRRPGTPGRSLRRRRAGDIHEIGKTIVCSMLSAADVHRRAATCPSRPSPRSRSDADLLLLSALLTTTMPNQQKTIEALKAAGLRDRSR